MLFKNKTVWITGASSGIGRELAVQFAQQGANVILSSRSQEKLEAIKAELAPGNHKVVPLDMAQPERLMQDIPAVLDAVGRVDILVNNAGISQRSLFLENEFKVYRQLMEVNYFGLVAMTKAVLPRMIETGGGSVVAISSVAGKVGSKFRTGYSGSKYAVVGFMDCLRAEVTQHGIHCLTICPGSVKTAIGHNSLNGQGEAQNKPEASIENGMDPADAARQMLKAIAARKDEVVIGKGISSWAPTIKRFFPQLFNMMTAKTSYR
ncbi:SDR family oxidoreductase [Photobacterium galatheae]|uniref:3-oxoacyl-ACP reductase n=1 Tax=Photobacterium galatheae TaxID=1654360 RepID=A0A066RW72_9GAMM|nr:SDR family oxidoreductase [Photobacterium galatheae]KDM93361.1 3-oxoacyl-ACP reductase [Photobacterium galatheae]MCM0150484.1 SDR family oxidoreductase [Photobacterium galatheae]